MWFTGSGEICGHGADRGSPEFQGKHVPVTLACKVITLIQVIDDILVSSSI